MAQDEVTQFMKGYAQHIGTFTGMMASHFRRDLSKDLVQMWAHNLIKGVLNGDYNLEPLEQRTITRKERRGSAYANTPLVETGRMLQALEFRVSTIAGQSFDIIELGIRGDENHADRGNLSLRELFAVHEYGIGVPARPILTKSALEFGYRATRIFEGSYQDATTSFASGYTPAGVKAEITKGRLTPNTLEQHIARGRRITSDVNKTEIGYITSDFEFVWE